MSDTPTTPTATAARPTGRKDSHWYSPAGEPCYEIIGKTTGKPRPVTIRDARDGGWLPSVTTILKVLHKEGLVNWMIEQACLACLTTPQKPDESLDAFVYRVLHVEHVQDEESEIARDKGTEIHAAMEAYFLGEEVPEDLKPWIGPAADAINQYGELVTAEKILVGDGYAGKTDLILDSPDCWWLWDYKSTKKLPDPRKGGAWPEHRLQASAYAMAYEALVGDAKPIRTGNVYVSSVESGKFVICEHEDWRAAYIEGFSPLVLHWQWMNRYYPGRVVGRVPEPKAAPKAEAPKPTPPPEAPATTAPAVPSGQPTEIKGHKVVWTPGVTTKCNCQ